MTSEAPTCSISDCYKKRYCRGFCSTHYYRFRVGKLDAEPRAKYVDYGCIVPNCGRSMIARGLCNAHYQRKKNGVALSSPIVNYVGAGRKKASSNCPNCGQARVPRWRKKDGTTRGWLCKPCEYPKREIQRRLREYGMTAEQYEQLKMQQGNLCAICNQPETVVRLGAVRPLAVDHNHLTRISRGLLCQRCNVILGLVNEDPARLELAAKYLRQWEKRHRVAIKDKKASR